MLHRLALLLFVCVIVGAPFISVTHALTINEHGASTKIDSASFSRNGKFFLTNSKSEKAGAVFRLWRTLPEGDKQVAEQVAIIDDPFFAKSANSKLLKVRAGFKVWKHAVPTNDGSKVVIAARHNDRWIRIYLVDVATGEKSYIETKMPKKFQLYHSCGLQLSDDDRQGVMCVFSGLIWFDIAEEEVIAKKLFDDIRIKNSIAPTMLYVPGSQRVLFLYPPVTPGNRQDMVFYDLNGEEIKEVARWDKITQKQMFSIDKIVKDMAIDASGSKLVLGASHYQFLVDVSNPGDIDRTNKNAAILGERVERLVDASNFKKHEMPKKYLEPVAVAISPSGERFVVAYDKGYKREYLFGDDGKMISLGDKPKMNSPVVAISSVSETKHWLLVTQQGATFIKQAPKTIVNFRRVEARIRELAKAEFYSAAVKETLAGMPDDPGFWGYTYYSALYLRHAIRAGDLTLTDWGSNAVERYKITQSYTGERNMHRATVRTLFDYGVAAVMAKRVALAEIALSKLKKIVDESNSPAPNGYAYQADALLESLIISKRRTTSQAYARLLSKKISKVDPHYRRHMISISPNAWHDLGKDKKKFQYVTGLSDDDLQSIDIFGSPSYQKGFDSGPYPFPDLNGKVVPPPGVVQGPAPTSPSQPTAPAKKKPTIKLLD